MFVTYLLMVLVQVSNMFLILGFSCLALSVFLGGYSLILRDIDHNKFTQEESDIIKRRLPICADRAVKYLRVGVICLLLSFITPNKQQASILFYSHLADSEVRQVLVDRIGVEGVTRLAKYFNDTYNGK